MPKVAVNGLEWQNIIGYNWKWHEIADNCYKSLDMAGNGLASHEITGNGWKRLKCNDNDNEYGNYND